jgi:two-component system response regulator RegX3
MSAWSNVEAADFCQGEGDATSGEEQRLRAVVTAEAEWWQQPGTGPRILLVGGGHGFWDGVAADLAEEGFEIDVAASGAEALLAARSQPALIVLDAGLPDMSGVEVTRQLRSRSQVPIIVINGRDSESDVLSCFEAGADDYVLKPIRVRELLARMRAVMRKAARVAHRRTGAILEVGNVSLDPFRNEVTVAGRWLHMPAKEFALLEILLSNVGRVARRDLIMQQVWGRDWTGDSKTLDAHVGRLRQRLQDVGATASITTIRGYGYRYEVATPDDVELILSDEASE